MKALVALLVFGANCTFAATIDFQVKLNVYSESSIVSAGTLLELGCDERFVEEGACLIERVIDQRDLPYSLEIGDGEFSISEEGLVQMGFSYGDYDASTGGVLQLPMDDRGNLIPLSAPLKLSVSGGDHASGVWDFSADLQIMVE